ncbi:MAG TPA: hypothetical protein VMU39_08245 [Solirubrobacteraceae bacterium]|nr:hypothetical protein [Solirubrobacteraceae bacterium]
MSRSPEAGDQRGAAVPHGRIAAFCVAAVAGLALAALAGLAVAKSFTLNVAKRNVTGKSESILVDSHGMTLYELSPETTHHLLCTPSACLQFWPPLKVAKNAKLTKAGGIKGKLGTIHRGGFFQVTLDGRPVYFFSLDTKKGQTNGQGQKGFGGTWHVVTASAASKGTNTTTSTTTTTTTTAMPMTSTTSPYCYYPPCP